MNEILIKSFSENVGISIGNLTSQVYANIYLNELDRFIHNTLKPKHYARYGDDFVLIHRDLEELKQMRGKVIEFLEKELKLSLNSENDQLLPIKVGVKFLGVMIFPSGKKLINRMRKAIWVRINSKNISSYYGLLKQHENKKWMRRWCWYINTKF